MAGIKEAIEKLEDCLEACDVFGSSYNEFEKDCIGLYVKKTIKEVLTDLKKFSDS